MEVIINNKELIKYLNTSGILKLLRVCKLFYILIKNLIKDGLKFKILFK
jgi:hypothetical protein